MVLIQLHTTYDLSVFELINEQCLLYNVTKMCMWNIFGRFKFKQKQCDESYFKFRDRFLKYDKIARILNIIRFLEVVGVCIALLMHASSTSLLFANFYVV